MPKRRTRKEKIIATLHRKLHKELPVGHTAISMPIKTSIMPQSLYVPLTTKSVYFMADLKKSLFLTGIIIALELLLFLIQSRLTR